MRKLYLFIFCSVLIQISCVTIPEMPVDKSPECLAYYFPIKKKLKLHQENQWGVTAGMTYLSFIIGFAIGNEGLIPLTTIPFFIYYEYKSAKIEYTQYLDKHCKI